MQRMGTSLLAIMVGAMASPVFAQQAGVSPPTKPERPVKVTGAPEPRKPSKVSGDVEVDPDIVVTARRREERITDVPAAIDVLDRQAIDDRGGFVTLEDIANNTPSVNFAATSTPATAEISIRGSATARSTNAEGGVGLYRNGVYVGGGRRGGRSFTRMDFLDTDRIEVLRGVQGALYGRNAVGGAINLINVQPQFNNSGYFRAGYESYLHAEIQGAVNVRLSDRFAVRISGDLMEQGEGAFYNPYKREYFDEQRARGIRGQIRFRSGPLDIVLLGETSFVKNPPLVFALNIAPSAAFPKGVYQDPYNVGWNGDSVANQKQRMVQLSAKLDLGFAEFSANGSLRQRDTEHGFDADGLDPDFLTVLRAGGGGLSTDAFQQSQQNDQTANAYLEAHFTDKGKGPLRWLLGYEHVSINSDSQFSTTRTPTKANPSPGSVALTTLDTFADAFYGSLGYQFTPRFSASGELRYTHERKRLISDRLDLRTRTSLGARYAFDNSDVEENVSYAATLSYKLPSLDGLLYARYGTGFRAGGFNDDLGDPRAPNPVTPSFNSEHVKSYEIGAKGKFIRPLNFSFAAYQTNTADNLIQVDNGCGINVPACPVGATIFLRNSGDARTRGAEGQVDGRIRFGGGTSLRLTGSVGYIDARIISGRDSGKRVPQVPEWLFTAGANLLFPLSDRLRGFANLQYNSRIGGVQEIDQTPKLEDFYRLDARIGVRLGDMELAVFANNVTDKRYRLFTTASTQRVNYPRSFGVQFSKRWR